MKPRYAELAEELIQAIGAGKFEVGSSLPSEVDLSEQYGVSRATVRSALERVQELGLISRRKRAGIRVESAKPKAAFSHNMSSVEDLVQFAVVTERHVRSVTELSASPSLAGKLGVDAGTRLLRVEMLRVDPSKPDAPLCWTDVYLEAALGAGIKRELRNSTGLICDMVERRFGRSVHNVRQEIRAIGVPDNLAEPLGVKPDSHALEIVRRYLDSRGLVFEATVSVFPADRYSYALELMRQG
ncbi:GntR family transcriptional regulator [Paraburkholderia sabiae]|uniref:GntR family transcriptional regulator n=1 Tax=Paraburkholderia sabiae TaxID=273251 RepID=A0ABU9QBI5_9BURK|nr:GntR family transcriptional regulator [Paraburkholderia sabiae]WJZ71524.1 GntR family transcriptional regulator [Paraburkholderia sabiae]CAG9189810.1 Transcriptional regulator, GntR family [Paraburkholderia sabiae]